MRKFLQRHSTRLGSRERLRRLRFSVALSGCGRNKTARSEIYQQHRHLNLPVDQKFHLLCQTHHNCEINLMSFIPHSFIFMAVLGQMTLWYIGGAPTNQITTGRRPPKNDRTNKPSPFYDSLPHGPSNKRLPLEYGKCEQHERYAEGLPSGFRPCPEMLNLGVNKMNFFWLFQLSFFAVDFPVWLGKLR